MVRKAVDILKTQHYAHITTLEIRQIWRKDIRTVFVANSTGPSQIVTSIGDFRTCLEAEAARRMAQRNIRRRTI
ncbi:hypothetical protein A3K55_02410 [Candidatus Shapirobacteria bacterium RBG_13_44_7]|uniref:Uncharacterized protein n=1 Tax=Candidatus Shapirobacteria bacterium RBG_13_44_7 TaxID=1802149 RepID=A0A1F7SKG5_9BACT|nr:MAG: hypothetical protein A3K55_02410 [Candidatus Shapirobacteria bacterium RBG_13_44_7]